MRAARYQVGIPVAEIETPALLVDVDLLERNIERMSRWAAKMGISLRPHSKTHKCPTIAHKQIRAGAIGITCAKISEAEIMGYAGVPEILIANQVPVPEKIERLVSLSRHCHLIVAVDDVQNVIALSGVAEKRGVILDVIIERDVGMGRCGTRSNEETVRLVEAISRQRGLRFMGLMGYEGHTVITMPRETRVEECKKANAILVDTKRAVERAGFETKIVSAGGTGTYDITGENPNITELQVGSYITMDWMYKTVGVGFELALTVLTTVVSRPDKETAVIDVGIKGITKEFGLPPVKDVEGAEVASLSEEHGILRLSGPAIDLKVGQTIELIPTHGCTTINLHDRYFATRRGHLECIWAVAARGAFS
jgi:D-serine deaminase-like pyridoxal phosphate-dependent protein